MSHDFTCNPPDFTKSAGFHVKFARFHEIRNERPIARNGKAYVYPCAAATTAADVLLT